MSGSSSGESKPESASGKRTGSPDQELRKHLQGICESLNTIEATEARDKNLEDWKDRVEARFGPMPNPWLQLYEADKTMFERSEEASVDPQEATAKEVSSKSGGGTIPTFREDFEDEGVIEIRFRPEIEEVIRALEEIRQDCHYDRLSNRHPGVSAGSLKILRWALNNNPGMVRQALDPKPRNLAILATRNVARLLARGFGNFDPDEELTDSTSLASKAEILLVMEHVCPNAFAQVPAEKRALANWWSDCGLKNHPESRGYAPGWGAKIRAYFGIPESIP